MYCNFVIVPVFDSLSPILTRNLHMFFTRGASGHIILSSRNFEVPIQKRNTHLKGPILNLAVPAQRVGDGKKACGGSDRNLKAG